MWPTHHYSLTVSCFYGPVLLGNPAHTKTTRRWFAVVFSWRNHLVVMDMVRTLPILDLIMLVYQLAARKGRRRSSRGPLKHFLSQHQLAGRHTGGPRPLAPLIHHTIRPVFPERRRSPHVWLVVDAAVSSFDSPGQPTISRGVAPPQPSGTPRGTICGHPESREMNFDLILQFLVCRRNQRRAARRNLFGCK